MQRWQKLAVGVAVVAALVAYQRQQDAAESREALAAKLAASEKREQDRAEYDREAACIAGAMHRAVQPATAVNGCLEDSHAEYAIWLSSCLEAAAEQQRGAMTALDVDYHWSDCAHEEQIRDELSG